MKTVGPELWVLVAPHEEGRQGHMTFMRNVPPILKCFLGIGPFGLFAARYPA